MLAIYSTLTREQRPFESLEPGRVRMYVCGVTVYDYCHIGHGRTFVAFDVIRRWLEASGFQVTFVRNVTDVDDKIIRRAAEKGITTGELTATFTKAMQEDMRALGCLDPTYEPHATEFIAQMLDIVSRLEKKGLAYAAEDGDVNYAVRKFKGYGKLSGRALDDMQAGARIEGGAAKRDPMDFALWKHAKPGEPQWDSPWGPGRPGWHIECSGISIKHLGEYLDIHCGGIDNAFPHHTNEIAQSEAYLGHKWCNYWFHVHHLNTENGKMSKSKGEFLTVSLLEEKGYDPIVYRLFCLQSHYRRNLVFSWENLDNAAVTYQKLISKIAALQPDTKEAADEAAFNALKQRFETALNGDLNTSLAVTALYDALKAKTNDATKLAALADFDQVLGLNLLEAAEKERKTQPQQEAIENDPAVVPLLEARAAAKKAKNWAEADRIRDEIKAMGYEIIDTPQGAVCKRI